MPKAKTVARKPKKLDSQQHHCSQCNRPKLHEVYEHEDGVLMSCPCGHTFVDVIIRPEPETSETEEGVI